MKKRKFARNAPCPCGSGRKYKGCHGATGAVDHSARERRSGFYQQVPDTDIKSYERKREDIRQERERLFSGRIANADLLISHEPWIRAQFERLLANHSPLFWTI